MRTLLAERRFPIDQIRFFASAKSAGTALPWAGGEVTVEDTATADFAGLDLGIFSAGAAMSREYAPQVAAAGAIVVDNSSAWRGDADVPLVVAEVNPEDALDPPKGIIANPNCSTIQAVVALKPLYDKYGIKRVIYSTYQAVAGSGIKGIKDLEEGIKGNDICVAYPHPIFGNCLPHIDVFLDNGYTKEEMKMVNETHKILHDDRIGVTATTVRVPVFTSHSESINVEFEKPFGDIAEVRAVWEKAPGLVIQDDPAHSVYPLPREVAGTNEVYVGRLRRDFSLDSGINFWCVADNTRKGAATNAVQIAQLLLTK